MAQELKAVTGIRSMLAARANVERVLHDDVSWLLPGRQLSSIEGKLGAAATDALAGAGALGDTLPNATDRLKHAAALLADSPLTADRATWNSGRASLVEARDAINEAIVGTRDSLETRRQLDEHKVAQMIDRLVGDNATADDWAQFADLAELPMGLRPLSLEHVTAKDVKLVREQATRLTEGLPGSTDPRLQQIAQATHITSGHRTRAATEERLAEAAEQALRLVGASGDSSLGYHLGTVSALQRLDGALRPRALDRARDIPWLEASSLASRGSRLPAQWEGFQYLRTITELQHPQASLEELLKRQPQTWVADDWRRLAAMVRIAPEERPPTLASMRRRDAGQMDTVASMLDKGQAIPSSWKGFGKANALRASTLWSSQSTATEYLQSIVRAHPSDVTKAHLSDLDALRQLPEGIRPNGLAANDERWARVALSDMPLTDVTNRADMDGFMRLSLQLQSKDELRATLARIDDDVAELTNVQARYGDAQVPRGILQRFGADLRLLRGFENLPGGSLLEDTEQLVRHNIDRLDGKVGGGYGRHVEYADLGRIRENVRLLTELAREQALGESDTVARARAAAAAAASDAAPVGTGAADDTAISW